MTWYEDEYRRRMKARGYEPTMDGMDDQDIKDALEAMDRRNSRQQEEWQYPRYKPVDPGLQARILRMFGQPYDPKYIREEEKYYLNGWDNGDDDDDPPQAKPMQNLLEPSQGRERQPDKPWTLNWGKNDNMFGAKPPTPGYRPEGNGTVFPSRGVMERLFKYGPGGNGMAGFQPMSANVAQPDLPSVPKPNISYPLQPKNIIFHNQEITPGNKATPEDKHEDPLPEGTMITSNDAGANIDKIELARNYPDVTDKLNALMAEYEEKFKDIKDKPIDERLRIFYNLVTDKGILDLKRQPGWESPKFLYNGEVVNNDVPGNILYGYLGKHFDFPDTLLYFCAGGNQIANAIEAALKDGRNPMEVLKDYNLDTFGDDPRDTARIRQGIETWNKKYPPKENLVYGD